MDSISKYVVQLGEHQDEILSSKLLNVNIRLLKENLEYKQLISIILDYMISVVKKEFIDYAGVVGISGANIGVPFNIIGLQTKYGWETLINPTISGHSNRTRIVLSNCGSLRLKEQVRVRRYEWVTVHYYNILGNEKVGTFFGREASTIQHEVDHNRGIVITDKQEG